MVEQKIRNGDFINMSKQRYFNLENLNKEKTLGGDLDFAHYENDLNRSRIQGSDEGWLHQVQEGEKCDHFVDAEA